MRVLNELEHEGVVETYAMGGAMAMLFWDEAIATAAAQELDGVPFRVMRPEHLAALWLQAGGAKRRERVELLRQAGVVDESTLADLLTRHRVVA